MLRGVVKVTFRAHDGMVLVFDGKGGNYVIDIYERIEVSDLDRGVFSARHRCRESVFSRDSGIIIWQ